MMRTSDNGPECRSSRPEISYKKVALRNFPKSTGKQSQAGSYIKKVTPTQVLSVSFVKFLRTHFL